MGRECPQIFDVATEHDAARFRTCNDDGVHRGAALGKVAQLARATSKGGRQVLPDVAGLEQTMSLPRHCAGGPWSTRRAPRKEPAVARRHPEPGRGWRRPHRGFAWRGSSLPRSPRRAPSARLGRRGIRPPYALGEPLGARHRRRRRFTHLIDELGQVPVRLLDELQTPQLGANGALQELRGRELPLFDGPVQLVGKVDLQPWHTPNYTPTRRLGQQCPTIPTTEHSRGAREGLFGAGGRAGEQPRARPATRGRLCGVYCDGVPDDVPRRGPGGSTPKGAWTPFALFTTNLIRANTTMFGLERTPAAYSSNGSWTGRVRRTRRGGRGRR